MKRRYPLLAALALALGVAFAPPASAHGHADVQFGLYMGGPVGWPYYYPPAYYPYYYPPAVVQPSSPPVYIERQDVAPESAPSTSYWYYCRDAKAYYPYVKQCPGGWQRVAPEPPQ